MKKDIPNPPVEDVAVAVVHEESDDGDSGWNVYLLNLKNAPLRNVLVASTGYGELNGETRKTSTLRHFYEEIGPADYAKIEPIMDFTFGLTNEYWVSFQLDDVMYDKCYLFLPETIQDRNCIAVPLLEKKGVMIK